MGSQNSHVGGFGKHWLQQTILSFIYCTRTCWSINNTHTSTPTRTCWLTFTMICTKCTRSKKFRSFVITREYRERWINLNFQLEENALNGIMKSHTLKHLKDFCFRKHLTFLFKKKKYQSVLQYSSCKVSYKTLHSMSRFWSQLSK